MEDKLLVIDGSSILFRAYYALPEMRTSTGKYTNGVLGFLNILFRAMEIIDPTQIAIAFDLSGPTFRNEIYEEYKANRSETPEDLKEQFGYIKEVLESLEYTVLELPGYEADDIAGTLARRATELGDNVYLLTGDKDYLQLVNENTKVLYTLRGVSELEIYDIEKVKEEFDIGPDQFIDMLGLMGDPSDNIPGIPGVGEKTAVKLLKEFGSIDNLYKNADQLRDNKTNQRIKDSEDIAKMSRDLARIDLNTPIDVNCEKLTVKEMDKDKVSKVMGKYELNSLMKRLGIKRQENKLEVDQEYEIFTNKEVKHILNEIKESKRFSFKLLTKDKPYEDGDIKKIGICTKQNIYIIDGKELNNFKEVIEDPNIEKLGYNIKDDIVFLIDQDIDIQNYNSDIVIGEYILDPVNSDSRIDKLSTKYNIGIFMEIADFKANEKKELYTWDEDLQIEYLASVSVLVDILADMQKDQIKEQGMEDLYYDIELPLIKILADMEYIGITVDKNMLIKIGEDLELRVNQLTEDIQALAEKEFNLNSPKQLGEVLFEDLKLPVIKRTKTGYSTNIDVLLELEDEHEIIPLIIEYRSIAKLKNTYVDGFIPYIGEDGKIHSQFNQAVTATGRLSSASPNLQNIPIRTEEGRIFRKIFTSSTENNLLLDADYSQIELRILAHISDDEAMIESFNNNEDIHRTTASKVFDIPFDEVSARKRDEAKAVNFGMVYGISAFGLSQDLKTPRNQAQTYIDNYFDRFKGVKNYMDQVVKDAKDKGYVTTLYGRRRYLPELESRNWNVRNFGERVALNMPIQGTAADIIKKAMIEIYNELKKRNLKSQLVLQIHDELLIDTPIDELEEVKEIVKNKMENIVDLRVPVVADIDSGKTWYDSH